MKTQKYETLKNSEVLRILLINCGKGRRSVEGWGSKPPRKIYKLSFSNNGSNLKIVSMIPGDYQELPDAYLFSDYFGGIF